MAFIDSSTWFISTFPSVSNLICVRLDKSTLLLIFSHILPKSKEGWWLTTWNWSLSSDSIVYSLDSTKDMYFLLDLFSSSTSLLAHLTFFSFGLSSSWAFLVVALVLSLVEGIVGLGFSTFLGLITIGVLTFLFFFSSASLASSPSTPSSISTSSS